MTKAQKIFQTYLDKEAKAVESFKEEMERLDEQYKAILEKEKAMTKAEKIQAYRAERDASRLSQ